uniref:Uncharacterized protein n=1 Tax=Siphoviridae sp. ctgN495 TaxID=2825608 RepID=A0A8S5UCS6_9CAUD|nr:MAG TPA: hypothetical protein [Siphoviridae sp. ctgN495]
MRINKNTKQAEIIDNKDPVLCKNSNCKEDAILKIREAISCLSPIAKEDEIARESIANLSVILFDLQ